MDMYIPLIVNTRASTISIYVIFCVRLLQVCSFYCNGHFQSL